ncbi:hypothetical protein GJ496_004176 [Pomphorhynchus laevis]|nr:hypothetical protein GJ496_004176 [Pomphorhynchus laevis]
MLKGFMDDIKTTFCKMLNNPSVLYNKSCGDEDLQESISYLERVENKEASWPGHAVSGNTSKMYWYPDNLKCYIPCELLSTNGDVATVYIYKKNEKCTIAYNKLEQMNPPNFELCEDMIDLSYLNDASILHNVKQRYLANLIYTYSGIFCVTINPYRYLPIYTDKLMNLYRGSQKDEMPPHLFAVADTMFSNIFRDKENQSILITGESGSGKTENTKTIIKYLAHISPSNEKPIDGKSARLEDQIISANPLLESYGNAKTVRNDNSSRFGKFVRIHFTSTGFISGADIDTYLLEKSRVTFQRESERSYHIFYQLTSGSIPGLSDKLLIENKSKYYQYINQGALVVDTINDGEDLRNTDLAMDILGFSENEKLDVYKITSAIMIFGNSKWKQRGRQDQAQTDGTEELEKVTYLLGIETFDMIKAILTPKIKVGSEFISKGQSKSQVISSVAALAKSIYERLFRWIVKKVNFTLTNTTSIRKYYVGILDIAGFEIFAVNNFEQFCINYTNERLQQFFNHHMFVMEQEEYKNEKINWHYIDFGLDLQPCIDLIEKPLGIFSILEEECILPKSTDQTFLGKVSFYHAGKNSKLVLSKNTKGQTQPIFSIFHYAGLVQYNLTGWIEKNRNPINITAATLFKYSKNTILSELFDDISDVDDNQKKRINKAGSMHTLSVIHKSGLSRLMSQLACTFPHFVRCILPNESKIAGKFENTLVLH